MKNIKFISLALSMLICFVAKAQEKPVSKEHSEKKSTEIEGKSFTETKDTIPSLKVPSDFIQNKSSKPIKIICAKSLSETEEPIYILDEIIVNSKKIAKVNPNDIESIKVLKGIDATSIYGSRAINGVVIITTKDKN